ncbi:MAG: hypothetical protein LBB72_02680 [Spirochaetaceae bacterium]|jgi:transposase|nr:hypothetical protein [Spirochaetaceae bacterium]
MEKPAYFRKLYFPVERFFRRLRAYRGTGTRYDKLALMFAAFIWLALRRFIYRNGKPALKKLLF